MGERGDLGEKQGRWKGGETVVILCYRRINKKRKKQQSINQLYKDIPRNTVRLSKLDVQPSLAASFEGESRRPISFERPFSKKDARPKHRANQCQNHSQKARTRISILHLDGLEISKLNICVIKIRKKKLYQY